MSEGRSASAASAAPVHVLVVDDDPLVRQMIADYLGDYEMRVTTVRTGREMAGVIAREFVDLLLLDLRLPGEDGLQIARALRERSKLPIIVLTARKDEADRIMSLELGADDYLTKPFSLRELLARIRALLRRSRMHETPADVLAKTRAYRFEGWELDVRLRRLTTPDGAVVALSNAEFNLLAVFLASPQRVLAREQLLDRTRLHSDEVFDRSVDVQVGRLRKKLGASATGARYIVTERGVGYLFATPVTALAG